MLLLFNNYIKMSIYLYYNWKMTILLFIITYYIFFISIVALKASYIDVMLGQKHGLYYACAPGDVLQPCDRARVHVYSGRGSVFQTAG